MTNGIAKKEKKIATISRRCYRKLSDEFSLRGVLAPSATIDAAA